MTEADDTDNSDDSETTEGEQDESTGDNETPVIEEEQPPVNETEDPVLEIPVDGDQITGATTMGDEDTTPVGTEHTVTDVTENKTGYVIDLGEAKVADNGTYSFTVKAAEHYEIKNVKAKIGDDNAAEITAKSTAEDGTKTYELTSVTGNVEITVTAEKIKYTLTVTKTDSDSALDFSTDPADAESAGIESGTTLTFTAKLKEANKNSHKISELSYQVGSGEKVTPPPSANGVYTIANVKGNVVITVTAEKIPEYKVSIPKDNLAEVTDIKINGAEAEKTTLGAADEKWEISAKEGSRVSFKLKPAQFYEVTKVMNGENEVPKDKNTVYTIEKLEADTTLTVTSELDETQCYAFTFALTDTSDEKSATATISLPEGAEDKDKINGTTKNGGDKVVSRNEKVILTFTAATGYELDDESIKATGATLEKVEEPSGQAMVAASAKYELTMTAGTPATVTVKTDPIGAKKENAVAIKLAEGVKNLTLQSVKVDDEPVEESEGKYAVKANAKRLSFEIKAAGPYEPTVTNKANAELTAKVTQNKNDTIYKYTILANVIPDDGDEYTVTENAIIKTVSFTGDTSNVNTVVSVDGKALTDEALNNILQGQTVTVKVTQKDSCELKAVSYKVGETAGPAVKVVKGAAEFSVKVTDNVEITITAKSLYKPSELKDSKNQPVLPVKNVYNVSYDGTYTAGIVKGTDAEEVVIKSAELLDGKNKPVAPVEGKTEVVSVSDKTATLKLADAQKVAGQKLTLKLHAQTDDETDEWVSYTLNVSKVISTISAPSSAKQPTDTEKGYKVTTNGEVSKLTIAVNDESAEDVIDGTPAFNSETGLLMIKTGQAAGTAKVVISDGGSVSKTIAVTATALISQATAKPTVKLKSASDIDLTLTLGAKKIDTPEKGAVLYEVKVTPVAGEGKNANLLDAVETKYFVKKGDSQDETIRVAKDKVTENGEERDVTYGDGGAWKYDVKVALVHVKDKLQTITASNIDDQIVANARSAESTTGTKPFATQIPAWEVNLKLKKGTTTVYTGQTDAMIATPQFTKTTTYTAIENDDIVDITYPGNNENALSGLKITNGQIYASATENTAVGKHTIQVTAKAANTMYASRATVVVTVVRGIDSLGVTVPSVSVFKPVKKAATLKATAYYNNDKTGKVKAAAPKTKKVKWDVVKNKNDDAFTPSDHLYGMVTVKNGTVTVNKDYIISPTEADNQFVIKATVDNGVNNAKFIGKASAAYSEVITITNAGADLHKIAVVQPVSNQQSGDTTYKVVAVADGKNYVPIEASTIKGCVVKAFTAAATDLAKDKTYDEDALKAVTVPDSDVSYKSSSAKNVAVDASGTISVTKPAKTKVTVAANDGSKAKADISLEVTFDKTNEKDLELKIFKVLPDTSNGWKVDGEAIYDPSTSASTDLEYNGSAVSKLKAEVMVNTEGSTWASAPAYANFDITISGGKKAAQSGNTAYFTADKRDVKIILKDKSTNESVTYELTNNDILSSKDDPAIGAKALGKLYPVGTKAEQKVDIEISKLPKEVVDSATEDQGALKAAVEIDWSKMNDKNRSDLLKFATDLSSATYEVTGYDEAKKKAKIELTFKSDNPAFAQKSYALKVTVGKEKDNVFTAATKPAAVKVDVEKVKKFTYKPTASYTIGLKDAGAVLTGKASIPDADLNVTFNKLLNANIRGTENSFTDNFEIKDGMLTIRSSVANPTEIVKDNLTGYLVYSATTDKDYYDNKGAEDQLVKITVKIKDKASTIKYSVDKELTIENSVNAATEPFAIMAGETSVEIAGNYMVQTRNIWISPKLNDEGKMTLTLGKVLPQNTRSFNATIYFAPKGSKYASIFENSGQQMSEEQWEENLQYAASVTVTVKVTPASQPEDPDSKEITEALKTAISTAVKTAATGDSKTITIKADSTWDDTLSTAVLAAANKAEGVSPDFEVVAAESEQLKIENNKATLKVVVQQKKLPTNKATITITDIAVAAEQETP